jgi:hypothetical protein
LVRSKLEYGGKLNEWGILFYVERDGKTKIKLKKKNLKRDTDIILGRQ